MPRQKCYDVPGGDTVTYDIVDESNGYRQPTFELGEDTKVEFFRSIRSMTCRDDDIFLNSYPKTGTNWLWEMLKLMITKTSQVGSANKLVGMIEAVPLSIVDEMPSPRILNTHIKVKYLPEEAAQRKLKTIFICRNPKDVVVSFYNHTKGFKMYEYQGKFENYLQMFVRGETDYGSYAEYLREWQQHIRDNPDVPFHVVYYEDLKEDCVGELKRLREFLNLDVTDDLLSEIADNCSVDKYRKSKESMRNLDQRFNFGLTSGFSVARKGQIGDWRNWFTVAQNEMFEAWWEKESKGLDMFKFRFT